MSLPQNDKEKQDWLAAKRKAMPNGLCWDCPAHDPKLAPNPCEGRSRFQERGYCTKKASIGVKK